MHHVDDPADPLLADFVALNDPERRRVVERTGGYFVVEGVVAIERLLRRPEWTVRRLALLPKVAGRLRPLIEAAGVPVAVASQDVLRQVVGFDIHRGALASVDRRAPSTLDELVALGGSSVFVALEGLNDHENLGAIYRGAAAFGAAAVLLDPTCADPFYRRSVRVSQGNVLTVPTASFTCIDDLHQAGITTVALSPGADADLTSLRRAALGPGPIAIVVGAEGPGLAPTTLAAAHHRVRIAMATEVDSLNVATAAAIALFHLRSDGQT